ncbi:MAG: molybdenum cofactor biosynthesis protein MoaE [Candidatus Symbiobacter sp.]|nr:molybdenum cofactor biosynthesis protein MoaE [Candidatus Symbiobacter sp.]
MARVQAEMFDVGAEFAAFTHGRSDLGGVVSFVGLTRDFSGDATVHKLELEHYPGMTERQLNDIERQAVTQFTLQAAKIIHRYGILLPSEAIVLVMAAAPHRAAAFEGCWFMIDWLKTKAPFWKREHRSDGSFWLEAKASDDLAAARWARG